jgi:hemerythrin-like domain-containing protein
MRFQDIKMVKKHLDTKVKNASGYFELLRQHIDKEDNIR